LVTRRGLAVVAVAALLGACGGGGDEQPLSASATSTTVVDESTTTSEVTTTTVTVAGAAVTTAPSRPATTAKPSPGPAAAPPPAAAQPTTTAFTPDPPAIAIQNFAFSPATLRIARNTKVTATNRDAALHTWTADGGQWSSGDLALNMTFDHTFTSPGTFAYHCDRHPSMKGTVQVV
jgi:plastocyanin